MTNLNLLAYLVALANIQSLQTSGAPAPAVENLSVKFGDLHSLSHDLQSIPNLDLNNFRDTGYFRNGNTGRYLSKNLRDFIYEGIGEPSDEGVIFTVIFKEDYPENPDDTTLPILLHKEPDLKQQLGNFIDYRRSRRQRSLVDTLKN